MRENASADDPHVLRVVQRGIFERLTRPDEQRPWAISELVREIGDQNDVQDALADLRESGLVHRCGEFVWATRAALAAEAIEL